jgi:hypothetical protein
MGRHLREMSSGPVDVSLPWDPAAEIAGVVAEIAGGLAVTARDAAGIVRSAALPARHRTGRGRHAADPQPAGGSGGDRGCGPRGGQGVAWVGMAPMPATAASGAAGLAGVAFGGPELRSQPREVPVSERRAARAAESERLRAAGRERIRPRARKRSPSGTDPEPSGSVGTADGAEFPLLPVRPRRAPGLFPAPACPSDRPDVDTMQRVLGALRRL